MSRGARGGSPGRGSKTALHRRAVDRRRGAAHLRGSILRRVRCSARSQTPAPPTACGRRGRGRGPGRLRGIASAGTRRHADPLLLPAAGAHRRPGSADDLEMGKPVAEARGEIAYAAEFLRHFAGEATRISGGYQTAPAGRRSSPDRQAAGGAVPADHPWNFPMAMGTRKLGPAIAAGCAPCESNRHTRPALSMLALVDILREAGVPDGAVSVVPTSLWARSWSRLDQIGASPASCPSPGRPGSEGCCSNNAQTKSFELLWSWAAMRPFWFSRTPMSTKRWLGRWLRQDGGGGARRQPDLRALEPDPGVRSE